MLTINLFPSSAIATTLSSSAGSPKTSKKSSSHTPVVSAKANWSPRPPVPPPNSRSTTATRKRCTWCGRRARADDCASSHKAFRLVHPHTPNQNQLDHLDKVIFYIVSFLLFFRRFCALLRDPDHALIFVLSFFELRFFAPDFLGAGCHRESGTVTRHELMTSPLFCLMNCVFSSLSCQSHFVPHSVLCIQPFHQMYAS